MLTDRLAETIGRKKGSKYVTMKNIVYKYCLYIVTILME